MHTRQSLGQSNLYFCMVKIFKHIFVQKNIKMVKSIENLHCQKVVGTWGVKNISSCQIQLFMWILLPKRAFVVADGMKKPYLTCN